MAAAPEAGYTRTTPFGMGGRGVSTLALESQSTKNSDVRIEHACVKIAPIYQLRG